MKEIKGPIAPLSTGSVIYQVTLASGMIITSPTAFGLNESTFEPLPMIVGEDGRVFVGPLPQGTDDSAGRQTEALGSKRASASQP